MIGIYQIDIGIDQVYVGSSVNIERRIKQHKRLLNNKRHPNNTFQKFFNGYFEWSCIEQCEEKDLLAKERYYSKQLGSINTDYFAVDFCLTDKIVKRFNEKIEKTGNCWIWSGGFRSNNYGWFSIKGRKYSAHRIAYAIYKNQHHLKDSIVLHLCDNKRCVNPNHLVLGSHSQNHIDRVNKGIGCKLNKKYAKYIRDLSSLNISGQEIADIVLFEIGVNITKYTVTEILSNRLYKDINYTVKESYRPSGEKCSWSTISKIGIEELRLLYNTTNLSLQKLGEIINNKYGSNFSYKTIHKIVKNQRWKDPNYIPLTNKERKALGGV